MIRISKLADYAVQILQQLMFEGSCVSASKCSKLTLIPETTASKVLKMLAEAKLVTSIQGPKGGYKLAISADDITLAQIVCAIEGKPALTDCVRDGYECPQASICGHKNNWTTISQVIFNILDSISLKEMATDLSKVLEPKKLEIKPNE